MLSHRVVWLLSVIMLAACAVETPTLTPTRELSGPTLAPSPFFVPRQPTIVPPEMVAGGQNDPTAAALPPGDVLPPLAVGTLAPAEARQSVELTAEDGALLPGDFYRAGPERKPGVLLLAENRSGWGDFPARLYAAGYTVLVMGMRPESALSDFRVMLGSLTGGDADPARIGVIGAGSGADTALLGCSGDLICDTVVLISPSDNPALVEAMGAFNPRPLLLTASQEDAVSFGAIQALQAAATGDVQFQTFERAGQGLAILQNRPDLGDLIIAWLGRYLV